MPLLPIRVYMPVSECSPFVRVQGQLSGATVRVTADGVLIAEGKVASADALIEIMPGVTLVAGQKLHATQSIDEETSPSSPEPAVVQARPSSLASPVVGVLQLCSECLFVGNIMPGAQVVATSGTGPSAVIRGEADKAWITKQVGIAPPAEEDDPVRVRQEASLCNLSGESVTVNVDTTPPPQLAPPTIETPVKECQASLRLRNVEPGAIVSVERSADSDFDGCISASEGFFAVTPLQSGEELRVRQAFPGCELQSRLSDPITVAPVEPIPAPVINGYLAPCEGTTSILLTGLLPTARIRILIDGVSAGMGEVPPNTTVFPVPISPLPEGAQVAAQQGLCGQWSPSSNEFSVQGAASDPPLPEVPGPLYPCAAVVRVFSVLGWIRITVHSALLGAPIGQGHFWNLAGYVDVPVAPTLLPGDTITATLEGCGSETAHSAPVQVTNQQPAVNQPVIQMEPPLQEGMTGVPVSNVIPGAIVEINVEGQWRGQRLNRWHQWNRFYHRRSFSR